jgi:formylglycine-generating enzyme required for sulfatase activity
MPKRPPRESRKGLADWYAADYYQNSPRVNPLGPESGTKKILKGGSWISTEDEIRIQFRMDYTPDISSSSWGFRCAFSEIEYTGEE